MGTDTAQAVDEEMDGDVCVGDDDNGDGPIGRAIASREWSEGQKTKRRREKWWASVTKRRAEWIEDGCV
jgi:hypothetical protein